MIQQTIETLAGVTSIGQLAGRITLTRGNGDNVADLTVEQDGHEITVHLDHHRLVELMVACGAAAKDC